ncbi:MAG TPA: hypothetical protein VFB37_04000, partial [Steroidobacteraceae bacterium]|nr:hypothetical protein [Steroidobacteraceae bacterium]
ELPKSYPDTYSHAHPTDSEGRPVPAASPAPETAAADPRQQDWVGGVSGDSSMPSAADAARAQGHERGT